MVLLRSFLLLLLVQFSYASLRDSNQNCKQWADQGECDSNPEYMLQYCAYSCNEVHKHSKRVDQELQEKGINSFYDLSAKDIDGDWVGFWNFRNKVVIITNVASYCGYTESHYKSLVEFYSAFKDQPVEVLAFPCNQFGKQEPGSASEIKEFAKKKGVEFRMMQKVDVNGDSADLVFKFLKLKSKQKDIKWNFDTYFVVSPQGDVEAFKKVLPMDLKSMTEEYIKGIDEEL